MKQEQLKIVSSDGLSQNGETDSRWEWVETSVWTERMLNALHQGVKGGKWHSLIDKIHRTETLESAYRKVAKNKGKGGVDHVSVEAYGSRLDSELTGLREDLRKRSYNSSAIRRVHIPKPGKKETRALGIPTVRDRVVQTATRLVIEPIFEADFSDQSYGFRPGRGCKDALREVDRLLKEGKHHVVEVDLRRFFDTLNHERLMTRLKERISDQSVQALIQGMLEQGVMEQGKEWRPEEGAPQGGPISPLLANIYLNPLDHQVKASGYQMIRYADDMVILCESSHEAQKAKGELENWVKVNELELHPEKTRVVDMGEKDASFEFLGYRFHRTKGKGRLTRYPRAEKLKGLRQKLSKPLRRNNGKSLEEIIRKVNQVLKGWFEYFKHANKYSFPPLDSWVRMRLRSILRRRQKQKGRGKHIADSKRWPNTFFEQQGLFSLCRAHAELVQSARR
jgi:RNA-directed DNA polymerase